jgi:hypothetical protein
VADYGQDMSLSRLGSVIGCCECGNELLGSTKSGKVLDYRHDYSPPSSILHSVVSCKLCRLSDIRGKDD